MSAHSELFVSAGRDDDRRWRDGRSAPRSAYEASIMAGLDGDYDPFDEGDDGGGGRRWRGGSRGAEVAPTNTLFVRVCLNALTTACVSHFLLALLCV